MRIALLEDDEQEKEQFLVALHAWDPTRDAECYSSIEELMDGAKRSPYFTVAFLDVCLPMESGIDAAKKMRVISPRTELVFVTTSQSHAIEAFNMNALHYIVKPISSMDIREVFERIRKNNNRRPSISLKTNNTAQMIHFDDIAYIASDNHQVQVHLRNGGMISAYMRLSDIQQQLDETFLKVQRSIIVNADYVERMNADNCVLKNKEVISLSRKDRSEIRRAYDEFVFLHLAGRTGMTI